MEPARRLSGSDRKTPRDRCRLQPRCPPRALPLGRLRSLSSPGHRSGVELRQLPRRRRHEIARAIGTDSSGNVYVAGTTSSPALPVSSTAAQTTYGGGTFDDLTGDVFVAKFSPAGALLYLTYLGGAGDDVAWGSPSIARATPTSPATPPPRISPSPPASFKEPSRELAATVVSVSATRSSRK